MTMDFSGTIMAPKIGRRWLLLLILGALVSTVIVFSMIGTAGAGHEPCALPAPHTQAECNAIEVQVETEGYAAAAAMADPSICFFGPHLCALFQADRDSDIDDHLPAFRPNSLGIGIPYTFIYQERHDELVQIHIDTVTHEVSKKLMCATRAKRQLTSPETPLSVTWGTEIRRAPAATTATANS